LSLRPAEGLRVAELTAFYARVLGLPDAAPPGDERYRGWGKAALANGELVGLVTGNLQPDNEDPDARVLYLHGAVHPAWRRRGTGRDLLAGLIEEVRGDHLSVTLMAMLQGGEPDTVAAFLLQQGFGEASRSVLYQRELTPDAMPQDSPSLPTVLYRGGDAGIEAAIVDLHRRAYRGRKGLPALTSEEVRRQSKTPGFAHVLMFDVERLVGQATGFVHDAQYVVDSLAVARSHWGTGASDALLSAMARHGMDAGCQRIVGLTEESNRASRALMERLGFEPKEYIRRFLRRIPAR
jgi:GNAT superfamily N-acetyltransferase